MTWNTKRWVGGSYLPFLSKRGTTMGKWAIKIEPSYK
jgi:hypothetical protein